MGAPILGVVMQGLAQRRAVLRGLMCLFATSASAAVPTVWNMIRYQGGTIDVKVNSFDWNTTLSIVNGGVEFNFAGRKRIQIEAAAVLVLSFGTSADKRVSDLATLRYATKPMKLFAVLSKPRDHLVSIEFKTASGAAGGVLLEVYSGYTLEILHELRQLTSKPVDNWP